MVSTLKINSNEFNNSRARITHAELTSIPRLTSEQIKILKVLIGLYLTTPACISSEKIAKILNKRPGTVRSHMSVLKAIGLVEGVSGFRGGYKPTFRAYEVLLNHKNPEKVIHVFVNGSPKNLGIKRLKLIGLSNPNVQRALLQLLHEPQVSVCDNLTIIHRKELVIYGKVSKVGKKDVTLDIERVVSIPNKDIGALASPLAVIEAHETIKDAAHLLLKRKAYCGLVVKNKDPLGIITLEHIIKAVAERKLEVPVETIANPRMKCVNAKTTLRDVIGMMTRECSKEIVIVKNEKFSGVVSISEIINFIANWISAY